jgi:hypothetical protein
MSLLMMDKTVEIPPGYAHRACVLVRYRLPLLRHCFILCHEAPVDAPSPSHAELMAFFLSEAGRLAKESVGDPQAFMLLHSGQSIRKRSNWHLHVFVVQHRWQKAWVYSVLAMKNIGLTLYNLFRASPSNAHGSRSKPKPLRLLVPDQSDDVTRNK